MHPYKYIYMCVCVCVCVCACVCVRERREREREREYVCQTTQLCWNVNDQIFTQSFFVNDCQ